MSDDPPQLTLPNDPDRWERGDWAFDPKEDEEWEDPKILRRRIGTPDELVVVADAIVRKVAITLADSEGEEREIVNNRGALTRYAYIESVNGLCHSIYRHSEVCWDARYVSLIKGHPTTVYRTDPIAPMPEPLGESGLPTHLRICESVVEYFIASEDDVFIPLSLRCLILKTCNCLGARFQGGLLLDRCHFASDADFSGCTFGGLSGVTNTHFSADAKIVVSVRQATEFRVDGCIFSNNFHFGISQFSSDAILYDLIVKGNLSVQRATANNIAIDGCVIENSLRMDSVVTKENVSCSGTTVYGQFTAQGIDAGMSFVLPKIVGGMASIHNCNIYGSLYANRTEFQDSVRFDNCQFFSSVLFQDAVMRGSCIFTRSRMVGDRCSIYKSHDYSTQPIVTFARCRIHSRLSLASVKIGPAYCLDFRDIEFIDGGSLGVRVEQLFPKKSERIGSTRTSRSSITSLCSSPWRSLWRSILGVNKNPKVCGENSTRLEICGQARSQYESLVATLALQRGDESLEDKCRWRANELRRRVSLIEHWERVVGPMAIREGVFRDVVETSIIIRRGVCFLIYDIIWKWLVERTMVGYLLYVHRLVVSGVVLMLACGLVYCLFASPETIAFNGALPAGVEAGSAEAGAYAMEVWNQPEIPLGSGGIELSGLYFSLTTFVTLGYGDFAPLGWFKLVTGFEALAGVTLIALFTVAWGRKMIR